MKQKSMIAVAVLGLSFAWTSPVQSDAPATVDPIDQCHELGRA